MVTKIAMAVNPVLHYGIDSTTVLWHISGLLYWVKAYYGMLS